MIQFICKLIMSVVFILYQIMVFPIAVCLTPLFFVICFSRGDTYANFVDFWKSFAFIGIEMLKEMWRS